MIPIEDLTDVTVAIEDTAHALINAADTLLKLMLLILLMC